MDTIPLSKPLSYPRPTSLCSGCRNIRFLVWGEKLKPHWRHSTKTKCRISNAESEEHKLCKDLLIDYLKNGGSRCQYETRSYSLECDNFIKEFKIVTEHGVGIFDVAGIKLDGNIVYGIEIWYKHKTDNIKPRSETFWYELKTEDIIMKLYKEQRESIILFEDHRNDKNVDGVKIYYEIRIVYYLLYLVNM